MFHFVSISWRSLHGVILIALTLSQPLSYLPGDPSASSWILHLFLICSPHCSKSHSFRVCVTLLLPTSLLWHFITPQAKAHAPSSSLATPALSSYLPFSLVATLNCAFLQRWPRVWCRSPFCLVAVPASLAHKLSSSSSFPSLPLMGPAVFIVYFIGSLFHLIP